MDKMKLAQAIISALVLSPDIDECDIASLSGEPQVDAQGNITIELTRQVSGGFRLPAVLAENGDAVESPDHSTLIRFKAKPSVLAKELRRAADWLDANASAHIAPRFVQVMTDEEFEALHEVG